MVMSVYNWIFNSNLTFDEKLEKSCRFAKHKVEMNINKSLKEVYKNHSIWSEFEACYNKEGEWIKQRVFYFGDWSNADFKNDWRFKEVKEKRKQLVYKGLCCIEKKWTDTLENHPKNIRKFLEQKDNINRLDKWL